MSRPSFSLSLARNIKLWQKIFASFLLMALITAIVAGVGLRWLAVIEGHFTAVTEQATPLLCNTRILTENVMNTNVEALFSLTLDEDTALDEQQRLITAYEQEFTEKLRSLATLLADTGFAIDQEQVGKDRDTFYANALELIRMHREVLSTSRGRLDAYDDLSRQTHEALDGIIDHALTQLNSKEDKTKTLLQAGEANSRNMEDLLSGLFEKDTAQLQNGLVLQGYVLSLDEQVEAYLAEEAPDKLPPLEDSFAGVLKKTGKRLKSLLRAITMDEDKQLHETVATSLDKIETMVLGDGGLFSIHGENIATLARLEELKKDLTLSARALRTHLDEVAQYANSFTGETQSMTLATMDKASFYVTLLVIAGILVALAGAFFLTRLIVRPIARASSLAQSIAEGDLSQRLAMTRSDEIGNLARALDVMAQRLEEKARLATAIAKGDITREVELASDKDVLGKALREMASSLNHVVSTIRESTDQLVYGVDQINTSSQILSQGATEQASSLDQVTSSLNEISDRVSSNADNATKANQFVSEARDLAFSGNTRMNEMIEAMGRIRESSQSISKLIKAIDEIAFQTNLLALNAAVEAARAGVHGKGFAVVAEEVRSLAGRSAHAARETAEFIEDSTRRVQEGGRIADLTAQAFGKVADAVSHSADLVETIADTSHQQAEGVSQINKGLVQVGQVTHENTANIEETSASVMHLLAQAEQLRKLLSHFHLAERSTAGEALPAIEEGPDEPGTELIQLEGSL